MEVINLKELLNQTIGEFEDKLDKKNLKIENSYKATIRFLWSSRLSERAANKLCIKRNKKLQTRYAQR